MGYTGVYFMAHILIADDDPRTAEKLQALLASASHTTVVTRSGHEGIDHLKLGRFDLVITDLMMEHGTGLDVLEWSRANARDLPVLICSSYVRPEALRPHLDGLRCRIVNKPFQPDELLGVVGELLRTEADPPRGPLHPGGTEP